MLINENFSDEQLLATFKEAWFANILNYPIIKRTPSDWTKPPILIASPIFLLEKTVPV